MRKIVTIIVALQLIFIFARAQSNFNCSTQGPVMGARPAPPSNSLQLLVDLVPTSNDRTLDVNVQFWFFLPSFQSSLTATWTHSLNPSNQASVDACLADINSTFTNIPSSPGLSVPGYSYGITDAKIKFVQKAPAKYIINNEGYLDVNGYASGVHGFTFYDPNAINIYVGTSSYTFVAATTPTSIVADYQPDSPIGAIGNPAFTNSTNCIHVNPEFFGTASTLTVPNGSALAVRANIVDYSGILAHECAHILGLLHPSQSIGNCLGEVPSFISPSFGCNQYSEVLDVPLETYTCTQVFTQFGSYWTKLFTAHTCTTIGATDNLMSQNSGCNRFLSPQQMAVMHYNLRDSLRYLLSAAGYTAAVTTNTLFNQVISNSITWQNGDRYAKGDIYINPDVTFTLKCGLAMTKGAKIIVPPRAQFVVDGGTITSISGEIWDGVFLVGSPSQPAGISSNTANPGSSLFQGVMRMLNNGTISQADIGVRNNGGNSSTSGGVILAQDANFFNNRMDVLIQGSGQVSPTFNPSWFNNCKFITNGIIGKNSIIVGHVRIYKSAGIQFRGCTFQHTTTVNGTPGYGIYSTDGSFLIDQSSNGIPCKFEKLWEGVRVANINLLLNPLIQNSYFIDNVTAGYIYNSGYFSFLTNTVQIGNCSNCNGLYLNQSNNYKIKNNQIKSLNYTGPGIEVYKSLAGSHEIYKNTFSKLNVGINCMDKNNNGTNDGLLMNCNIFNVDANYYDVVMSHTTGLANPTVKKVQGVITSAASASNVVRNIYGATCVGNQNKWQIYSAATQTVDHGANTNSTTAVTQPSGTCKSLLLNVVNKSINLDYQYDCPLYPLSSGGSSTVQSQRLSSLNDYIGNLQSSNTGGENDFEIQASVGSKLTLFLEDSTLYNLDSAINVLSANPGNFVDADLQLVFAYMAKTEYEQANTIITYWNNNGMRSDWVAVLTALINVEKNSVDGILSLENFAYERSLFENYCENENDAQRVACAVLAVASGYEITEPHAVPESGSARPLATGLEDTASNSAYSLYPNPASTGFYFSKTDSKEAVLEIHDLLGKKISTQSIGTKQSNVFVDMANLQVGLYVVTLKQADQIVYTSKIAKEN